MPSRRHAVSDQSARLGRVSDSRREIRRRDGWVEGTIRPVPDAKIVVLLNPVISLTSGILTTVYSVGAVVPTADS